MMGDGEAGVVCVVCCSTIDDEDGCGCGDECWRCIPWCGVHVLIVHGVGTCIALYCIAHILSIHFSKLAIKRKICPCSHRPDIKYDIL